ncbi:MAG: protein TonB [Planctomycetota bacterium]|jgi:protein TonB
MEPKQPTAWQKFGHGLAVTVGGVVLGLLCFLVLPLLQAITQPESSTSRLVEAVTTELPPPPPPEPEPEDDQKDDEPPPPDLAQEAPPLDLSELELALNPSFGSGSSSGGFALPMSALLANTGNSMNQLFNMSDLEQSPRVIFRARPQVTQAMSKRMPCTVFIVMTVDAQGLVVEPRVVRSDDSLFDAAALEAVRRWKFEPGNRGGKPDAFRVRQPVTFQ